MTDSNNLIRKNDRTHGRVLAKLLRNYNYGYARGMMTVNFCSTANRDGATYETAVHKVVVKTLLKTAIGCSCSTPVIDDALTKYYLTKML